MRDIARSLKIPPYPNAGRAKTWRNLRRFYPRFSGSQFHPVRSRRKGKTEMSTPTVAKLLLMSLVTMALACNPKPAFAQHHGGGSHGGGGSHRSGSRGGGGGFHGGRGHFGGKSFGRGLSAAPRQRNGGSFRGFSGLGFRTNSNSAYVGGRGGRSNRSANVGSAARGWLGHGPSSWASAPRSISSFNSNRSANVGSAARGWLGHGPSSWASAPRSISSFNPNRPPNASSGSRPWSSRGPSSWASTPRSTSLFNPNHTLPNSGNSRFGNSTFRHSSFSNSRNSQIGSRVPPNGSSRFADVQLFDSSSTSFNRESSFAGGDFSFVPDLFSLALKLGSLAAPGLGLLGSGLGGFGAPALDLLGSGLASFGQDASPESPQWGPGQALYSTPNSTCPR